MDESLKKQPTVWGVFVGDHGDQLEIFNSKSGPFPPEPGTKGYIAIGWPRIGDLSMFRDNYPDYIEKFRRLYMEDDMSERTFMTKANMPWYFAFSMKQGDWVICPSSAVGLLMVGKITGDYQTDYDGELELDGKKRPDFVHVRKILWMHIIEDSDPRHEHLYRIGQLTVSRPNITYDDLQKILSGSI